MPTWALDPLNTAWYSDATSGPGLSCHRSRPCFATLPFHEPFNATFRSMLAATKPRAGTDVKT